MQKRIFFLLALMALTFTGACIWSVTSAQEQPPATPPPVIVAQAFASDGPGEVISSTGPIELNPADLKLIQDQLAADLANMKTEYASGPETTGGALDIAGKQIQLPVNVYAEAFITSITCDPKSYCPEPPIYVLRYTDSDASIIVGAKTGKVEPVGGIDEAKVSSNATAFQWLVDALTKEGVTQ